MFAWLAFVLLVSYTLYFVLSTLNLHGMKDSFKNQQLLAHQFCYF